MTTTSAPCVSPGPCCVSESKGHKTAHQEEELHSHGRCLSGSLRALLAPSGCWGDTCDHSRRKPLQELISSGETDSKDSFLRG